jgi:hypothetical protein
MKQRQVFTCEVCGTDYETERAARFCEAQPVEAQPALVGETVYVRERYADADEERVVVSARVVGSYASPHLDEPGAIEILSADLCVHRWELHVNEPVQCGDSFHTHLVAFSFQPGGEKSDAPLKLLTMEPQ